MLLGLIQWGNFNLVYSTCGVYPCIATPLYVKDLGLHINKLASVGENAFGTNPVGKFYFGIQSMWSLSLCSHSFMRGTLGLHLNILV